MDKYHGKLKGKIVLTRACAGPARSPPRRWPRRYTDEELTDLTSGSDSRPAAAADAAARWRERSRRSPNMTPEERTRFQEKHAQLLEG